MPSGTLGIDPSAVHSTRLTNGLTVILHRDTSAPVVAINTYVKAGYFDETDDVVGIAHVLEHMFFKGTTTRGVGEISKQTKAVGGYLNAHTIYDHTSYYTVLPASSLADGLDIQADAYANSVIDAGELAKELEVIIQEAKRKADNPGAVTTETLYALLHDHHRIRRWRIGREDGLRKLTRDDLMGFYRNFYVPSNTILSISGDIDLEDTLRLVDRTYGALPDHAPIRSPGLREPDHTGFRYSELDGDIAQTQIAFGWRTVPSLHPDGPSLDVTASILASGRASRLYRAVRERKLAGTVGAYHYTPDELGVFVLDAEAESNTSQAAACAMWDQLRVIRSGATTVEEIERAQRLFASRWARRLETAEGRAAYLAEWEALGGWRLGQEQYDAFMRVSPHDVTRVAEQYLTAERAAALVYRPKESAPFVEHADAMESLLLSAISSALDSPERSAPLIVSSQARATFVREEHGVRVYDTPNRISVLVANRPSAAITYVGIYAPGGAVAELADQAGISALAARAALKGTPTRSAVQIAEAAELLGGSLAASVSSESFGWSVSVPRDNASAAMALLGDVLQNATLPDDVIETERVAMLSDVAQMRDDMYRYPMRLLQGAAFAGHSYGTPTNGTDDSLRALVADDVRVWYASNLRRAPFVVVIVGAADADSIANEAARAFDGMEVTSREAIAAPSWPEHDVARVESRDKAQTALALAFPAPDRRSGDRFAARLIATIASGLGGRFFDELRDKQSLAYTVHAFASELSRAGLFISYIATSPERETVARDGLLAEFAKLRAQPVTAEELTNAKRYIAGMHDIRQERGGAVLSDILDAWLFGTGLSELAEFVPNTERVTADDILRVAKEHFDADRRVEGIVRGTGRVV